MFLGEDMLQMLLGKEAHLVNGVHEVLGEVMLAITDTSVRYGCFHRKSIAFLETISKLSITKKKPAIGGLGKAVIGTPWRAQLALRELRHARSLSGNDGDPTGTSQAGQEAIYTNDRTDLSAQRRSSS